MRFILVVTPVIVLFIAGVVYHIHKRLEPAKSAEQYGVSSWAVWISGLCWISVTLYHWSVIKSYAVDWVCVGIGLSLFVVGVSIRILARRALGKYYSSQIRVLQDHTLIMTGIYTVIRHPGYLGFLLEAVGVSIAFSSVWGLLCTAGLFFPSFLFRINREEELLYQHFGKQYKRYAARTKKLIPYLF